MGFGLVPELQIEKGLGQVARFWQNNLTGGRLSLADTSFLIILLSLINTMRRPILALLTWTLLVSGSALLLITPTRAEGPLPKWWKGNLHTHSLWSDGNDYPEMIADWYKDNGYHFLTFSEHNVIAEGERWSDVMKNSGGAIAYQKYLKRFGSAWVETRMEGESSLVRLKTLSEFKPLFDEAGRFLIIPGEEVTDRWKTAPVHINVTNLKEKLDPTGGDSVYEVMQNNIDAIWKQRKETGQLMFPHVNHPNFGWGITAEELMQVRGENFFEVYNGHPSVRNEGNTIHASTERMWDIILTRRLTELDLPVMYGLATDDAHSYHKTGLTESNTGRGWVMVRSSFLTPEHMIKAMEAGDFYSSSGVVLEDIQVDGTSYAIKVAEESGVSYVIEFIGTLKGYDASHEPVTTPSGEKLRITHRYSDQMGMVLARFEDTSHVRYEFTGDEIYVRARVISSKLKDNPYRKGEFEMAWTQPMTP